MARPGVGRWRRRKTRDNGRAKRAARGERRRPRARGRGRARRHRARHPHAADRHRGAGRAAGHFRSRRARARLGERDQERRRSSRRAHHADRRCRQGRRHRVSRLRHEPFSPRRAGRGGRRRACRARAATKASRPRSRIADDLPAMVAGDALRLRAALENLADNAVKFTSEGTVVFTAGAEPAGAQTRAARLHGRRQRHRHRRRRARRICSVPSRRRAKTVARRYGGAGLGLVFVKRVAKAMGGDLVGHQQSRARHRISA